jgi:hypothetical protein
VNNLINKRCVHPLDAEAGAMLLFLKKRTGRGDGNKSSVISASFQIYDFQVGRVRDIYDRF